VLPEFVNDELAMCLPRRKTNSARILREAERINVAITRDIAWGLYKVDDLIKWNHLGSEIEYIPMQPDFIAWFITSQTRLDATLPTPFEHSLL